LGAILLANDITSYDSLYGKSVIVRKYFGTNNRELQLEQQETFGYAVGFENLIDFIMLHTQIGEKRDVKREFVYAYPRVAIREFVINALIHQDFNITGIPITIEIFSNRLSITNPGAPLNDINRLIDLPPNSRNEMLANTLMLFKLCEKRGSGIDKAIEAIENAGLPAVDFAKSELHTKVTIYPAKSLSEMNHSEKVMACYQHACLLYEDKIAINNQSLRERFGIDHRKSYIASRILTDTFNKGLIKQSNPENESRKYVSYIPYYG
jgi:predicted HTH transcriptional regulator